MIYSILRVYGLIIGYPLQLLFFKRKTYYEDESCKRSFKKGGKLIISNHFNLFDYVLTCFIVFPRKLTAVASEDPFKSKITRFGMKFFGAIEANRVTKSMRFMDSSAEVIKNGQLVIIYPEGRNTPDGNMHPFKHSYLVIAYRAGAPIIPMVTDGQYGVFKQAHVLIGKEIDVSEFFEPGKRTPSREELKAANDHVYAKMQELRVELERRKSERKSR